MNLQRNLSLEVEAQDIVKVLEMCLDGLFFLTVAQHFLEDFELC